MALCDQRGQQLSQADQQRRRLLETMLAEALGGTTTVDLPTGLSWINTLQAPADSRQAQAGEALFLVGDY
jgi:hypothetical protein